MLDCAGLALVPLVIADRAGNEIQAPMGVVLLGGLLSSTFLNMLVVPVPYSAGAARPSRATMALDFEEAGLGATFPIGRSAR
jgi:Cu/Ag efflux pump CusA